MLATWILGSLFLIFISGFLLYVLTRNISEPEMPQPEAEMAHLDQADWPTEDGSTPRIFRDYQIVFSPQAFVHYPFGLRVVIAPEGMSGSTPAPASPRFNGRHHLQESSTVPTGTATRMPVPDGAKPPRGTGENRRNLGGDTPHPPHLTSQGYFQESYYYNWPQSANEDTQLVVHNGHLEFESAEAEPVIRVELGFSGKVFQETPAGQEQIVRRNRKTVYSFWLTPLKAQECVLNVVISYATRTTTNNQGQLSSESNRLAEIELASIPLTILTAYFPIRLR